MSAIFNALILGFVFVTITFASAPRWDANLYDALMGFLLRGCG